MNKKDIVEALVAHYAGGNKARFGKMLGVTQQTIQSWVARNTMNIELIYAKCVNINPHWLLTGEGDMLRTRKSTKVTVTHNEHGVQNSTFGDNATFTGFGPQLEQLETECERLRAENIRLRDENEQLRQQNIKLTDKIINLIQ